MPSKSLVIEFAGLPGCGKSTVARLLASRLNEQGGFGRARLSSTDQSPTSWRQLVRKPWVAVKHATTRPADWLHYWKLIWRTRPGLLRAVRLVTSAQRVDIEGSGAPVVILDQGAAQFVWSILFSASVRPTSKDLDDYLDRAQGNCNTAVRWIVILHCPESIVEARLRMRRNGRSVLDSSRPTLPLRATEAFAQMRAALHQRRRYGNAEVLELQSEQSPESLADIILARIAPTLDRM